jgi:hypothetical protein
VCCTVANQWVWLITPSSTLIEAHTPVSYSTPKRWSLSSLTNPVIIYVHQPKVTYNLERKSIDGAAAVREWNITYFASGSELGIELLSLVEMKIH